MTITQTLAALLHHQPAIAIALLVLALLIIGLAIWILLPRADEREADIERQIQSLRRHADHAVATRPRVRANGYAGQAGHIKAAPKADKPKACCGGMCRHRADCSDHHCPGRLAANLSGTDKP